MKPFQVNLQINGEKHALQLEPRVSLLNALREFIGLTGTKKGCNQGACRACTVLVRQRSFQRDRKTYSEIANYVG